MVIDSHHHFWKYSAAEYGWIADDQTVLQRDYFPKQLHAELNAAGVDGVVTVQARQTLEETDWLLRLAAVNDFLRGVVGWVPLTDPEVGADLEVFSDDLKFVGVRHVLQGEPDDRHCLRSDFLRGVAELGRFRLAYDILILERQLPAAIELVDQFAEQVFVVNHIAKPRLAAAELEPWATRLRALAERPNVYCKVSGMVTEADLGAWDRGTLQPYLEVVLAAFTPRRLMLGTDWPVCLLGVTYTDWIALLRDWCAAWSPDEQARFLGGTAVEAYGLDR
ncbi:MAG: amidohydrolase family protein [Fimbriimonadaceae bacterium]|nr:amidohydrolase family protein [Fimbriimonadaceae bacterium]